MRDATDVYGGARRAASPRTTPKFQNKYGPGRETGAEGGSTRSWFATSRKVPSSGQSCPGSHRHRTARPSPSGKLAVGCRNRNGRSPERAGDGSHAARGSLVEILKTWLRRPLQIPQPRITAPPP